MQTSATQAKHSLMGDNPVLTRDDDWLNFDGFVQPLANRMIASLANTPFTVGILADWGQGKSSVMRMLQLKLESERCPTIWFEPWKYNSREEVWKGLAHTLVTQIEKNDDVRKEIARKLPNLKKWLAKLLFGRVFGEDGRGLIEAIDSEPWSPAMLHEFEGFLEKLFGILYPRKAVTDADGFKVPVVLFVDDLDRCLPGTALAVLEAMKLVLNRPGMIIVMGVAERELCRAVTAAYAKEMGDIKENVTLEWGYRYVRKIFQIPIYVPALTPQSLDNYVGKCLAGSGVSASLGGRPEWHGIIHGACEANLREIKRLINIFVTEMDKANANAAIANSILDPSRDPARVFFVQLLARRFPEFYTHILRFTGLERDLLIRFQNLFLADGPAPATHSLGQEGGRFLESADLKAFFRDCMRADAAIPLVDSFSDPLEVSAFLQFGLRSRTAGTIPSQGAAQPTANAFTGFTAQPQPIQNPAATATTVPGPATADQPTAANPSPDVPGPPEPPRPAGTAAPLTRADAPVLTAATQGWYDECINAIQDSLASGDFSNAERQARRGVDRARDSAHPELVPLFLGKTAEVLQLAGRHADAIEAFRQQLTLIHEPGAALTANRFMARSLRLSGRIEEALQVLNMAARDAEALQDAYGLLDVLGETARCMIAQDRVREARAIYERILSQAASSDKRKYMEARLGLAQIDLLEGYFAASRSMSTTVHEEARRNNDKEIQANALLQMALAAEAMGEPRIALDDYVTEREVRRLLGDRRLEAECLWNIVRMSAKMKPQGYAWDRNLADFFILAHRTGQAEEFAVRALKLAEEAKASGGLQASAPYEQIANRLLHAQK
jgi:tetratricopeptide (TPR) repeat protein